MKASPPGLVREGDVKGGSKGRMANGKEAGEMEAIASWKGVN